MNALVIARYLEPLDWILEVPNDFEVFIYNKGPEILSEKILKKARCVINLKNVGRESETYLCHMLSHFEPSHDFTVFSQGDPITHSPDFLDILRAWHDWEPVQALSWQWRPDKNIPPAELLNLSLQKLAGGARIRLERYSLTTWNPLDFFDAGAYQIGIDYRAAHKVPEGINIAEHFLAMCGFDALACKASAHSVGVFSYGGIFAVRSDLVRALPKERARMLYQAAIGHPVYGYILERMWLHLFGAEYELPVKRAPRLQTKSAQVEYCFAKPRETIAVAGEAEPAGYVEVERKVANA